MPWTHHSHSGQFCGHAASKLEDIVLTAIEKRMSVLCLTEHMTRHRQDFYPEEEETHDEASLAKLYDDFYVEARRLQRSYAGQIAIFVGFEGEWIRPESLALINNLLNKHPIDVWLGSVHHVHTYPIDYDQQVGLNYAKTLTCVKKAGITQLVRLTVADGSEKDGDQTPVVGVPHMRWTSVAVEDLRRHEFWQATA
ncbi:hypothetical protein D0863_12440 [Hortaea werneckii]|uniref:Histidinol-phosphatase n=1 Tax=Hortaea werneckii TaxID=91943 RepID=A0A3M7D1S7_HORWE|nr:hypothetical protein D0863_12440 [Hortaea werneckii]